MDPHRRLREAAWAAAGLCLALAAGCADAARPSWPPVGEATPKVIRFADEDDGPVLLAFSASPPNPEAPPEGLRRAMARLTAERDCAAALFPHAESGEAWRWLEEQFLRRRHLSVAPRLVLIGHGLGGTQAAEFAKRVLRDPKQRDVVIELLVTIDAVKNGMVSKPMGIASAAVNRATPILPTGRLDFIAYNSAPRVDGKRLRAHANYYQPDNTLMHGGPMDGAANQRLLGPAGAVTHENADQYALPYLIADVNHALR